MEVSTESSVTALDKLQVSRYQIPAFRNFPNTSIQARPLLIYHSAFENPSVSDIESHLRAVGVVTPSWQFTMYSTSHFHSNTHEVLSISAGSAKLCFGGEGNPRRIEPEVVRGDVIVIPAGVAHRLLEDRGGFRMVGSYPPGPSWDMCYDNKADAEKAKMIKNLAWFDKDPVYGIQGPALDE